MALKLYQIKLAGLRPSSLLCFSHCLKALPCCGGFAVVTETHSFPYCPQYGHVLNFNSPAHSRLRTCSYTMSTSHASPAQMLAYTERGGYGGRPSLDPSHTQNTHVHEIAGSGLVLNHVFNNHCTFLLRMDWERASDQLSK